MSTPRKSRIIYAIPVFLGLALPAAATPPRPTFAAPENLPLWPGASEAVVLDGHRAEPPPEFHEQTNPMAWLAADFANIGQASWRLHFQDATVELQPVAGQMKSKVTATLRAHEIGVTKLPFLMLAGEKVAWTDADGNPLLTTKGATGQGYQVVTVELATPLTPEVDFVLTADREVPLACEPGFMGFKFCAFGKSFAWITRGVLLNQGDVYHDPTSFDLHVVTPATLMAAAAGMPKGSDTLPDGRKIWHFHQPEPTENCAFSMGPYQPLDAPATETLPAMRVSLAGGFVANAPNILKMMQDVVSFYGEWFSPFPWKQLNMTQLENDFGGGQSFLSGIHANRDLFYPGPEDQSWLGSVELFAHEIGHQWWGNYVAPSGSADVALSESLAEFSASLYVELKENTRHLELMDNLSYVFRVEPKEDAALGSAAVFNSPAYVDIVYHKGAVVLHMLRRQLGDAAMIKAMHAYTKKFDRDYATIDDLRQVVDASSGNSLSWFFKQWFKEKGVVRAEVAVQLLPQDDGSWKVRVLFHQPDAKPKRFLLNAVLYYTSGEPLPLSSDVKPDGNGDTIVEWTSPTRPARVRLDPERFLLRQFATGTPADVTLDGLTDGADFVDTALRFGRGVKYTGKNGQNFFVPDTGFNELYDVEPDLQITTEDLDTVETWLGTEVAPF